MQSHFGGVSWPDKNQGFAIIGGMEQNWYRGCSGIYLLDEYESFDMRELIRQCVY